MTLLEYKGVIVPWVAIWSAEVPVPDDHPLMLDSSQRVRYREEQAGDRDSQRVLWVRNRVARGEGEPMFAQVHADRQRNAMITPRCQVCGLRMQGHKFLVQEPMLYRYPKQGYITTATPPVCDSCAPVAAKLCPQLPKAELLRVLPTSVGLWGYIGDVANADGTWTKGQKIPISDPLITRLLAKQIIVAITEWTEEPWDATSQTTDSTPS